MWFAGAVVFALAVACAGPEKAFGATCNHSLQERINKAAWGGVVRAAPCVYRERVVVNKPLTLEGQAGTEIRGSNVWSGWSSSDGRWVSQGTLPSFPSQAEARCNEGTYRCKWPEQVFVDGAPLTQVATNPGPGQFSVNSGRKVVLGANPSGKTVEVSVRSQWVAGAANNVTIRGFTMKHAANARNLGAITNRNPSGGNYHSGWTIINNRLSDTHAAVVVMKGRNVELLGNSITRGGQLGVHGSGSGMVVRNNGISYNNTEGFGRNWEAGGVKFTQSSGTMLESNEVHHNRGVGLWSDVEAANVTFRNNRLSHNSRSGILVEVTSGARVYGNIAWENGWVLFKSPWSPGISVEGSRDVQVYDNTVAWNSAGISVLNMRRNDGAQNEVVRDVQVRDNRIFSSEGTGALWWIQQDGWSGGTLGNPTANNAGYNNRYWYGPREEARTSGAQKSRFRWVQTSYDFLPDFNGTPGENSGAYVSASTKDSVLSTASVPAAPMQR